MARIVLIGAVVLALGACVQTGGGAPEAGANAEAVAAATAGLTGNDRTCVEAVAARTGTADIEVAFRLPDPAGQRLILWVGPASGEWTCIVGADGAIAGLEFSGSDGSDLA